MDEKEAFLTGLLTSAQKAEAEILPETIGMGAENSPDGVKVIVRGKVGRQTLEARAGVAADGLNSTIVDSLGLNKKRRVLGPLMKFVGYNLEGVETISSSGQTKLVRATAAPRIPGSLHMA